MITLPGLRCSLLAVLILLPATGPLQAQQYSSPVQQTQLIELYTSEGCSSCPPADKWLSTFTRSEALWDRYIPVAFHVDYWDYIGWRDRFADSAFSHRQRQHLKQGNIKQVYTPGVLVNGAEWRGLFRGNSHQLPTARERRGQLTLQITGETFTATFTPWQGATSEQVTELIPQQLSIAILSFNQKTPVRAGENKGELLRHDFVVLSLETFNVKRQKNTWSGQWPTTDKSLPQGEHRGFAAWLTTANSLKPIQAVGGWLP